MPYRDPFHAARCRAPIALAEAPHPLRKLWARRVARTAAGVVGVVGFAVACLLAARWDPGIEPGLATPVLLLTWPAMALAALATFALARSRPEPRGALDPLTVRIRAERRAHLQLRLDRLHRAERASVLWIAAAVALLAPLSIHLLIALPFGADSFDSWIAISVRAVWLPHLVVLGLVVHPLRRLPAEGPAALPRPVYGIAIAFAAAVSATVSTSILGGPGGVSLVAAVVVFLTGLLYIPLLLWRLSRAVRHERAVIADQVAAVDAAVALTDRAAADR